MKYNNMTFASNYFHCSTQAEDWLSYALELEQQGDLEEAQLALEEACLYEADSLYWNSRIMPQAARLSSAA